MTQNTEPGWDRSGETSQPSGETFEEFINSFSYGSRTDLLFKFLKNLSGEEAGEFIRGLLEKLGDSVDDGDMARLLEHVYHWNQRGYEPKKKEPWQYDSGPFTPLKKPIGQGRLGLLTATGHYVEGADPEPFGEKDMTQAEAIPRIKEFLKADPILTAIPVDTPREKLRVRHPGYDIRGVLKDPNVAFPLDRLREAVAAGQIGELLPDAYSFVGATAQIPLLKKHAPQWAEMLKTRQVDAMLLVPV